MARICTKALLSSILIDIYIILKVGYVAVFVFVSVHCTSTFLLDTNCLAPLPCTCSKSVIQCERKQLSAVPAFKRSISHTSTVSVNLYSNQITTIPAYAFLNISTVNATDVRLSLHDNKISSIASNAFQGIENSTTYLYLQNNNLTSIPSVLEQLNVLETLNIQGNPIHTLNPTLFANIGHSLISLNMDLNLFTDLPTDIHFLRRSKTLTLNKIPFSHINEHSFSGFETVLTSLTIRESKLENIPKAICHLTQLQGFYFRSNTDLIEPIVQPCKLPLVTTLYLDNNHLTEFPHLLPQYPSLTTLEISNNQIHHIKAEDIPYASRITSLYIYSNLLSRIPYAISHLKALSTLYIASNKIEYVEDNDLTGLKSLTTLYLQRNPLSYISPHAFKQNILLNTLDLDTTQLGQVPSSVMSLPKLSTFGLSGRALECTCNMAYLKPWNVSSINWNSRCESSTETVKDFILHSLPQCP